MYCRSNQNLTYFFRAGDSISKIFLTFSGDRRQETSPIPRGEGYLPGMSALLLGDAYRVEHVISNLPSSSLRSTAPFRSECRRCCWTRRWRRDLCEHYGVCLGRRPWYIQRELGESLRRVSRFAPTSSSKVICLGLSLCKQIVPRASTESMVSIRHHLRFYYNLFASIYYLSAIT